MILTPTELIAQQYEKGLLTYEQAREKILSQQEFLSCKHCHADDFIEQEELDEHQREEHPYDYHDAHCSEDDVRQVCSGLKKCVSCDVEWSRD